MRNDILMQSCYRSSKTRNFISNLWNDRYSPAKITFTQGEGDEIIRPGLSIKNLFDNYSLDIDPTISLIEHLFNKKIIIIDLIGDLETPSSEYRAQVACRVVNENGLFQILIDFSNSLVDEPYGIEKQIVIIKELLRNKFSKLENNEIKLKWEDFESEYRSHIQILRAIQTLRQEEYIDFELISINVNTQWFNDYENEWIPQVYGLMGIECVISIKQKLLAEWARLVDTKRDPLQYDEESGYLIIASKNKKYKFSEGNNINSKFFKKLVDNVNQIVPYHELAMIAWSKQSAEIQKLYEQKKKKEVNKKVTRFATDFRVKIADHKLNNILSIESNQGYMLSYKESGLDVPKLAQAISEMYSPVDVKDIPF